MIIRPFNPVFFGLLAVIVLSLAGIRRFGKTHTLRQRQWLLIGLSAANLVLFFVYKGCLSVDREFLVLSGLERFNWFSELPLHLCNINLFLIPLGVLTRRRSLLGFSFYVAPLGAAMALLFPEASFTGFSLFTPRILGFYLTHALLIVCGLALALLDFYRPVPRDYPGVVGTFVLLALGAHLVNILLRATVCPGANYFFTFGADVSILNLFWRFIPRPFFYELPSLLILLGYMGLVQLVFWVLETSTRRKNKEQDEITV